MELFVYLWQASDRYSAELAISSSLSRCISINSQHDCMSFLGEGWEFQLILSYLIDVGYNKTIKLQKVLWYIIN